MQLTRREALASTLAAGLAACAGRAEAQEGADESLDALARRTGRRFGSAVGAGPRGALTGSYADPRYRELLARQCGVLVSENELKWTWIRPDAASFRFEPFDRLIAFAEQSRLAMRGHTLLWHHPRWLPEWLETHDFGASPAAAAERMVREHVETVCRRYGGRIHSYDVVNEAVDNSSGEMRQTPFSRALGAADPVVDLAFHAARAAAPHAQLVYNDYMSWDPGSAAHRAGVLRLLEGFRRRDVPVDALGVQAHIGTGTFDDSRGFSARDEAEWRRFLDAVVAMDYDLVITEFDVHDRDFVGDVEARDGAVADIGRAYLDLMLDYPQLGDILVWGLSDRYSWLQARGPRADGLPKRPCPYDADFRPKPLRTAIAEALRNAGSNHARADHSPSSQRKLGSPLAFGKRKGIPAFAGMTRRVTTLAGRCAALLATVGLILAGPTTAQPNLQLNERGYFHRPGLDIIVFSDIYPEGHQTGVTVVQHGRRVAANGDLRLEASPGQWSPVPKAGERVVDAAAGRISQAMSYPDRERDGRGFNPTFYPDLELTYRVTVTPADGDSFRIRVDLDRPLPREWVGRVGFNFELFPGHLFGKAWMMDEAAGIFPRQPNGPLVREQASPGPAPRNMQPNGPVPLPDEPLTAPLAVGRSLVVAPDDDSLRMRIESRTGEIALLDGRSNHNNGWFIVRGLVPAGATEGAIEWIVTPNVQAGWRRAPVVQVSQVGYAPGQPKRAVIELDPNGAAAGPVRLYRLTASGREEVLARAPEPWGPFLRYRYATFDFSEVTRPGLYVIEYAGATTHAFEIARDVYSRHVWQPTLEYFLPVQMCHMRVADKYRVWHGLDHQDDALMAPIGLNHFDGYVQGPSTLTRFRPGERVPGLDAGGWHDAGDYDLRVESQMGTVWLLSRMVEEFGLDHDATEIDQQRRRVEIHVPDGRNDALQQIEHGLLSVLGGYRAMGRLYRGIISPSLRQYVHLGDAATMSDNLPGRPVEGLGLDNNGHPIAADDRWVFTEDNPSRELQAAGGLAAASRALRESNPALAAEALAAAEAIALPALDRSDNIAARVFALSELIHATGRRDLVDRLVALEPAILADVERAAWPIAPILPRIEDQGFKRRLAAAVADYQRGVAASARTDSPYGVPYRPDIWGAGWTIQERGVRQYFFHRGWPEHASADTWLNALNFVLGVHPGENEISFVSGVGAESATTAYGVNRADWSHIPGGVISGTALIRPDLPELKTWPFFWQQTEYVIGGGEANFMFLALAADRLYAGEGRR